MAETFGIRAPDRMVDGARDAVADWSTHARARGVPLEMTVRIGRELELRASEIG